MSAIVCRKRSLFEDAPTPAPSKRIRCSPVPRCNSPPRSRSAVRASAVEHLAAAFPAMDKRLIERALDECADDLDSAIGRLSELCLAGKSNDSNPQAAANGHPQWVEFFVSEMTLASSVDDARARASRVLADLEKTIAAEAAEKNDSVLKEQIQALVQENAILKRAVAIQHERQKDYQDKCQEMQQLISQYQQQVRTLEVNNYALAMHLKQADQQNSSISERFNRDIF